MMQVDHESFFFGKWKFKHDSRMMLCVKYAMDRAIDKMN